MITNHQKELISNEIIESLFLQIEEVTEAINCNQINTYIKTFFTSLIDDFTQKISLKSWANGLNTTIGQNFFENTAYILSDGEKREYTSGKLGNLKITKRQRENIGKIMADLSTKTAAPDLAEENNLLFIVDETELINAMDFSADVFVDDGEQITAIELKTVKLNSGGSHGEKQKILEGKAALFNKFPDHKISFYLGFPFDPTSKDSATAFDKERFSKSVINLNKSFAPEEILLAGELWDKLSGEADTMQQILAIINSIATVDFMKEYNFLNDRQSKIDYPERYREILLRWNLFSELSLFEKDDEIKSQITQSKPLMKIFNQLVFKNGKYNQTRYENLKIYSA